MIWWLEDLLESATLSAEFTAGRVACDLIMELCLTLRYPGVPVNTKCYMFRDNQSVVNNSEIPHSYLNTRHISLIYHRNLAVISAKILGYYWIDGKANPANTIVSKHCGYQQIWHSLQPLLLYSGNTHDLLVSKQKEKSTSVWKRRAPFSSIEQYDLLHECRILKGKGGRKLRRAKVTFTLWTLPDFAAQLLSGKSRKF
jgi:hypothetical protein